MQLYAFWRPAPMPFRNGAGQPIARGEPDREGLRPQRPQCRQAYRHLSQGTRIKAMKVTLASLRHTLTISVDWLQRGGRNYLEWPANLLADARWSASVSCQRWSG